MKHPFAPVLLMLTAIALASCGQRSETGDSQGEHQIGTAFVPKKGDQFAEVSRVDTQYDHMYGRTFCYSNCNLLKDASKEIGMNLVIKVRGGQLAVAGRQVNLSIYTASIESTDDLDSEATGKAALAAFEALDKKLAGQARPVLLDAKGNSFAASDGSPSHSLGSLSYDFPIQEAHYFPLRLKLPWGRLVLVPPEEKARP